MRRLLLTRGAELLHRVAEGLRRWQAKRDAKRGACCVCDGSGYVLHMYDRPGGVPGNQVVRCPRCASVMIDTRTFPVTTEAEIGRSVTWTNEADE